MCSVYLGADAEVSVCVLWRWLYGGHHCSTPQAEGECLSPRARTMTLSLILQANEVARDDVLLDLQCNQSKTLLLYHISGEICCEIVQILQKL